jgi:hypothetical protein
MPCWLSAQRTILSLDVPENNPLLYICDTLKIAAKR